MILNILIYLLILVPLIFLYLAYRNNRVLKFRLALIDACGEWNMNNLQLLVEQKEQSAFDWLLGSIPDYDTMLIQFWKPLKIEYWLTEEQITKLNKS